MKLIKGFLVFAAGAASVFYLSNPTLGVFELLPDNLPIIGNIDEAAATLLLLNCLAYFGLDLRHLFGKKKKDDPKLPPPLP